MKISLYKVLKISFIVGLLVVGLSDPQPTVQFDPDLSPGSVPAVDVPAQPGPVPVWGGDGAGQHSPGHRALGPRPHFLSLQPDKVDLIKTEISPLTRWVWIF